ncbi:MAG: anaerobic ribonucleoside-triphosphate reductase activating protein [Bacteroidaceae bacterium]|nr:anaerobic ribonucleoside-triphosphate reductase activating protein [Bacteroidaceae bacterium]
MKIASYDIVFQDVPGEVTLSLNLSQCPNRCPGCHSPQLQDDIGFPLDDGILDGLLERYGRDVTCVCFMGGDREPDEIMRLAGRVHATGLKTAWYTGKQRLPDCFRTDVLDYVKVGPYIESRGPLPSPDTNQRMYKVDNGVLTDITMSFRKKGVG